MPDFDTEVKLNIYQKIAETTRPPSSADVAIALGCSVEQAEEAFLHLYQKRLLVLEPGTSSIIRMAPPFSGIPTQHVVRIGDKSYYANCAWDALGVAAAFHTDADIESSCADCEESLFFQVRNSQPVPCECAVHFAVPAALWWKNIIYT